jgi:hypothetical protein
VTGYEYVQFYANVLVLPAMIGGYIIFGKAVIQTFCCMTLTRARRHQSLDSC